MTLTERSTPLSRHLRMIASGLDDTHAAESINTAADILEAIAASPAMAGVAAREALERIIKIDQHEKKITVETDPAGNTYRVEMIDGPCATVARDALAALPQEVPAPPQAETYTDPAELWDRYCEEVPAKRRSPQGAMAFAVDALTSPGGEEAMKTWTPEQYWEFIGGLAGDFERDQMRVMMAERGLSIVPQCALGWEQWQDALDEWAKTNLPAESADCITSWSDRIARFIVSEVTLIDRTALSGKPGADEYRNNLIEQCAKVAEGTGAAMFSDSEAAAVEALRADIASGIRALAVSRPDSGGAA